MSRDKAIIRIRLRDNSVVRTIRNFKIIISNIVKDLMEKFYDIHKKMRHFSRDGNY